MRWFWQESWNKNWASWSHKFLLAEEHSNSFVLNSKSSYLFHSETQLLRFQFWRLERLKCPCLLVPLVFLPNKKPRPDYKTVSGVSSFSTLSPPFLLHFEMLVMCVPNGMRLTPRSATLRLLRCFSIHDGFRQREKKRRRETDSAHLGSERNWERVR